MTDDQDAAALTGAMTPTLRVLRRRGEWAEAVGRLRVLASQQGDVARAAAARYAQVYAGRRGSMVVDVVASRQRRYERRVLPLVERWEKAIDEPSLQALASEPLDPKDYGLQAAETATMHAIASNLLAFAGHLSASDDDACTAWADGVEGLEHAHRLDPIVGGVSRDWTRAVRLHANALRRQRVEARCACRGRSETTRLRGAKRRALHRRDRSSRCGGDWLDLLSLDQLLWGWR